MSDSNLKRIQKRLLELEQPFIQETTGGRCVDYAGYREMCGVLRGLALAQTEIEDLLRKLKEYDNE